MARDGNREVKENIYYINAPAGTGKTHTIIKKIIRIIQRKPWADLLCITFTNRAADELTERVAEQVVLDEQIKICTIHSFLHEYFDQYFMLSESLKLYFEIYEDNILLEIEKNNNKDVSDDTNRNTRYLEMVGMNKSEHLTIDIIKKHLSKLEYSESQFSDYFKGRLSHDDLLFFITRLVERHPVLQKSIGEKYNYIFLDECQDTSSDILRLLFSLATYADSKVELYFFGDKMQEIYDNYDGTFEEEYKKMNHSIKLNTNYRSSKEIVDILSNLYGDLSQEHEAYRGKLDLKPTIYLTDNIEDKAIEFSKFNNGFLALRVFNRARFEREDVVNDMSKLYNAYDNLIPYGSKESHINILIPVEKNSSPDYLLNLLWKVNNTIENFENKQYGQVIQQIKNHQDWYNLDKLNVNYHEDKKILEEIFNIVSKLYRTNDCSFTIGNFISKMEELEFYREGLHDKLLTYELYDNKNYKDVLNVPLLEFRNLVRYNRQPDISTQHGVKGEGHDKILLVLEDSTRYSPYLLMYDFLEMYVLFDDYVKDNQLNNEKEIIFNLDDFQEFKYNFVKDVTNLEKKINKKRRNFNNTDIEKNIEKINELINNYIKNPYYMWIYGERLARKKENEINKYLEDKPFVGSNIKQLLKYADVERIMTAYKLFYVGCSRAKNELSLIVDTRKIESFREEFMNKFREIGFDVIDN